MASIPDDDLAALRAELAGPAYAGLDDAARFEAFHRPASVPNPDPPPTVPTPFTTAQVFGLLSPGSVGKLTVVAFLPDIRDKIAANDRAACGLYAGLLAAGGVITPDEYATLAGVIQATHPDPAWPATVPGPSRKDVIFPGRTWVQPDGSTVDYVPHTAFPEAR